MKPEYDRNKYIEYINRSSEWKLKREETFKLKGKKCQRCFSKKRLHVHHGTYSRLYNEDIVNDLYILCNNCHEEYHVKTLSITVFSTIAFINKQFFQEKKYVKNRNFEKKFVINPTAETLKQRRHRKHLRKEEKKKRDEEIKRSVLAFKVQMKKNHKERSEARRQKRRELDSLSKYDKKKYLITARFKIAKRFNLPLTEMDKILAKKYNIKT